MTPHKWYLTFTDDARADIRKLSSGDRRAIFQAIRELLQAENPLRDVNVKKLIGSDGLWRKRKGLYRIIFSVDNREVEVQTFRYKGAIHIEAVKHRKDAYRNL